VGLLEIRYIGISGAQRRFGERLFSGRQEAPSRRIRRRRMISLQFTRSRRSEFCKVRIGRLISAAVVGDMCRHEVIFMLDRARLGALFA
jgi:hypothetical protein